MGTSIPVDILKEGTKRNVDSSSACMKYQLFRLSSFESFPPKSDGRPLKLAKAGFLFTPRHPEDDTVTCFSCQTTRNNWTRFDDPMEIHQSLNPDCEFIKGTSGNVEIAVPKDDVCQMIKARLREKYSERNDEERNDDTGANDVPRSPSDLANPAPDCVPSRTKDHSAKEPRENSPPSVEDQAEDGFPYTGLEDTVRGKETATAEDLITETASFPNQAILATRLGTFSNWPRGHSPPSKDILAEAGFFYTGCGDDVKCFFCGGCLKSWENSDIPWEEHARWFPKCSYLIRIKGQKFVNAHRKPDEGTAQVAQPNAAEGQPINCRNLSLGELMKLPIVREALGFGLDESRIRQVVEMKSRKSEPFFTSCHEIINAAFDSDSKFKSEVEKKPEVPRSQLSPVFTKESEQDESDGDAKGQKFVNAQRKPNEGTTQAIREGRTAGKRFSDDDDDYDDDEINLKRGKRSRSHAEKLASGEYTSDDHAGHDTSGQQVRNSRHDQSSRDIIRYVVRKDIEISCRGDEDEDEDEDDSDSSS